MTTASEIISQAFRELNLVPLGTVLTTEQETEALSLLDRFLFSLLGFELGEFTTPWTVPPSTTSPVPAQYPLYPNQTKLPDTVWPYPPANVNILMGLIADTTIYMPNTPDDGARMNFVNLVDTAAVTLTVDGNGRLVQGSKTFSGTPAALSQLNLLYRADLGDWTSITTMLTTSESPLPKEYDTLLILGVAERLAPRYGKSLNASQERDYARYLKRLKTQFRQRTTAPNASPQPFLEPQASHTELLYDGGLV